MYTYNIFTIYTDFKEICNKIVDLFIFGKKDEKNEMKKMNISIFKKYTFGFCYSIKRKFALDISQPYNHI